uniref:Cytochrome c biogenesis B n=1 Tax=Cacopsylla melanoneura TaxID=428564 RepID=A0A8D9DPA2_9HEMI
MLIEWHILLVCTCNGFLLIDSVTHSSTCNTFCLCSALISSGRYISNHHFTNCSSVRRPLHICIDITSRSRRVFILEHSPKTSLYSLPKSSKGIWCPPNFCHIPNSNFNDYWLSSIWLGW